MAARFNAYKGIDFKSVEPANEGKHMIEGKEEMGLSGVAVVTATAAAAVAAIESAGAAF